MFPREEQHCKNEHITLDKNCTFFEIRLYNGFTILVKYNYNNSVVVGTFITQYLQFPLSKQICVNIQCLHKTQYINEVAKMSSSLRHVKLLINGPGTDRYIRNALTKILVFIQFFQLYCSLTIYNIFHFISVMPCMKKMICC